jgi:hypothetical protein
MNKNQIKQNLLNEYSSFIDEKVERSIKLEHNKIIGGHYFASASSECIKLYRDGYFIATVMMSHAINEGILKFVAERNTVKMDCNEKLINHLNDRGIITKKCYEATMRIWKSYRNDIHHMNPKVASIPFSKLAEKNIYDLTSIEKEIFGFSIRNGVIVVTQPKYWDIQKDGTAPIFLRNL